MKTPRARQAPAPSPPIGELVAAEVRAELARQKIKTVTVAAAMDVSPVTAWRKLNGQARFTLDDLDAVAVVIGISASDMMRRGELAS